MAATREGESLKAALERQAPSRALSDRKLLLLGLINERLGGRERAVLVGGSLVEFYTVGQYQSGDIDLVGPRARIAKLLTDAGFKEEARYLYRDDLGLVVEVPDSHLRPTETVVKFEFEGLPVYMVSLEDAIVDRLLAAKYWRSATDREQAILLLTGHLKRIDRAVLRKKAAANEVDDLLGELMTLVEAGPAKGRPAQP